jgi:toxin FitB
MLLDSNIIIYSVMPEYQKVRDFLLQNEDELVVSVITKLEVLGYYKLSNEDKELFEGFFQSVALLPVNNSIIEKAIVLRQKQKLSLGDSLIAATALQNNQKIFTNNIDDFNNIDNLSVISMQSIL